MQQDLNVIETESSKRLFIKNFTYGELITKEYKKGEK